MEQASGRCEGRDWNTRDDWQWKLENLADGRESKLEEETKGEPKKERGDAKLGEGKKGKATNEDASESKCYGNHGWHLVPPFRSAPNQPASPGAWC